MQTQGFSETPEKLMEFAQRTYKQALAEHNAQALAVEAAKLVTPADIIAGKMNPTLSKSLTFIAKQALPFVITTITGGAVSATISKALVELGAIICAGQEGPDPKFLEIKKRLNEISKSVQEISEQISRQPGITKIQDARDEIAGVWEKIMTASSQGDLFTVISTIHRIREKVDIEERLLNLESALYEPGVDSGKSLADGIREFYDGRLADTGQWLAFSLDKYQTHILNWYHVVARTYRLGTALLVLYEHCRDIDAGLLKVRCKAFSDRCEELQTKLRATFGVNKDAELCEFPAAKLLTEAAAVNPNNTFGPLYELRVKGDVPLAVRMRDSFPKRWTLAPDWEKNAPTVNKAVLFEYDKTTGFWWLYVPYHGEDLHAQPATEKCTPRLEWQRVRADTLCIYLHSNAPADAVFQIIPIKATTPRARLVQRKTADSLGEDWEVELVRSQFKYPALGSDNPDAHWDVFHKYVQAKPQATICCPIENYTDFVLVLDYAWSSTFYHFANYVWVKGDTTSVGAHGSDLEAKFRFSVYRVNAQGDVRDIVRRTFGPMARPALGLPALNVVEKELAGYIHLRLTVPTWGKASISAHQSEVDDPHWDAHSDNLIRSGSKTVTWSKMIGGFSMESANDAFAKLVLHPLSS